MIILPWQLRGKACCGKWAVENAPCLVIGVGGGSSATPRGSGCGISSRARLAGDGDCAIVFANNTCALIHSAHVMSVIFTCCDVWEEESNRNRGLKLVSSVHLKCLWVPQHCTTTPEFKGVEFSPRWAFYLLFLFFIHLFTHFEFTLFLSVFFPFNLFFNLFNVVLMICFIMFHCDPFLPSEHFVLIWTHLLCWMCVWECVYMCLCLCNLACLHHQLVNCPPVWSSGSKSDSIPDKRNGFTERRQPIGRACDSPLPSRAPLTVHVCPPTLPPPLSSLLLVFSNLHAGQTYAYLSVPSPVQSSKEPGCSRKKPEQQVTNRERKQKESGHS